MEYFFSNRYINVWNRVFYYVVFEYMGIFIDLLSDFIFIKEKRKDIVSFIYILYFWNRRLIIRFLEILVFFYNFVCVLCIKLLSLFWFKFSY